ncbi:MAG: hypothetical protein JWR03_1111, partial [Cohnella sp.]|nr:hypothetical protein [Cohnella sp.]
GAMAPMPGENLPYAQPYASPYPTGVGGAMVPMPGDNLPYTAPYPQGLPGDYFPYGAPYPGGFPGAVSPFAGYCPPYGIVPHGGIGGIAPIPTMPPLRHAETDQDDLSPSVSLHGSDEDLETRSLGQAKKKAAKPKAKNAAARRPKHTRKQSLPWIKW